MAKKKNIYLFAAIVGFIIVTIVLTALIDFSQSNKDTDPRAKASTTSGLMMFTGTVADYDRDANVLTIYNLMFEDSDGKSLGTWSITPPFKFNSIQFPPTTKVKISAQPSSFQIAQKTLIARNIEKN
ncbi:hypothetical protein ACFL1A_00530 [Patescibacteria group bacterium]